MVPWKSIFGESSACRSTSGNGQFALRSLEDLKNFLDMAHVRHCLVKPYQEQKNYPCVEPRELLPSFENDMYEYKNLPGFAIVAFARSLDYFSEVFQFDRLQSCSSSKSDRLCLLEKEIMAQNAHTMACRLPRAIQKEFRQQFQGIDTTNINNYESLLPFLLTMDRAQVMAHDSGGLFHLAGVFASFPSDIDSEIKRFGIRIGKFVYGDSEMYERNRMFVYQYLMELYGFPIVSERRTSSALFARKLHKMGENFLLRVMGQSDRTLTTYISDSENRRYPRIEKIALVAVDNAQEEAVAKIENMGFFLDQQKRVVIMRVRYRQHRFNAANVRQDRALSVASQEILHPLTGEPLTGLNIIKDATNMFLRLNDIVRGEYTGRTVYKRNEIVENTDTDEKRLKFLYSWLNKHQRRMISYNDEFFARVEKVIGSYLQSPDKMEIFDKMPELYQETVSRLRYVRQARKARMLLEIGQRTRKGRRITYRQMCQEAVALLDELRYEIAGFFPDLVDTVIVCVEKMLHDRYLQRNYIMPPENALTKGGLEIRRNYGRLVALLDTIRAIRKAGMSENKSMEADVA